ncbi:hypothetical protein Tco_0763226 [Tanacetum coccineum]
MDSMILLGQKNTLAEYMILSGADNRPRMLDKDLYDSWKSRMELYMKNREHGRMILESVEHGPLIWPTVKDNGVIKIKKYAELSVLASLLVKLASYTGFAAAIAVLVKGSLIADIHELVVARDEVVDVDFCLLVTFIVCISSCNIGRL